MEAWKWWFVISVWFIAPAFCSVGIIVSYYYQKFKKRYPDNAIDTW